MLCTGETALANTHAAVSTSKCCSSSKDLPGKQSCLHTSTILMKIIHRNVGSMSIIEEANLWLSTFDVIDPAIASNVLRENTQLRMTEALELLNCATASCRRPSMTGPTRAAVDSRRAPKEQAQRIFSALPLTLLGHSCH
jgi:hypothetical protein